MEYVEIKLSEFEQFYYAYKNLLDNIEVSISMKITDMKKKIMKNIKSIYCKALAIFRKHMKKMYIIGD